MQEGGGNDGRCELRAVSEGGKGRLEGQRKQLLKLDSHMEE